MTSPSEPEPPAHQTDLADRARPDHPQGREDEERLARAIWSRLAEPTDVAAHEWVTTRGARTALAEIRAGHGEHRWQARWSETETAQDLASLDRIGARLLIPGDEEWPPGLRALGPQAPFCLWVRGPLHLTTATTSSAAIVGARAATSYGDHVARELGEGCTDRGLTVVSGAAYGIDGAAHRGALAANGPTIAILASGIERPYPRGHEQLIDQIQQEGAVLSELPPGFPPTRSRFLARNRLIAAISQAAIVVEASHRSGALATAAQANALGRAVGAVPGPVTSAVSMGCHLLLRTGATCIRTADDIAELSTPRR